MIKNLIRYIIFIFGVLLLSINLTIEQSMAQAISSIEASGTAQVIATVPGTAQGAASVTAVSSNASVNSVASFANAKDNDIQTVGDLLSEKIFKPWDSLVDLVNKKVKKNSWDQLLDKFKISYGYKLDIPIGPYAGAELGYRQVTEPAYINNFQLRRDQWDVSFSAGSHTAVRLGAGFHVSVIFAQLFKDKKTALRLSNTYLINKIPWTSNKLLQELHVGDAVRLEYYSDVGLGYGRSIEGEGEGDISGDLNLGVSIDSRFIFDIFRMDESRVRLRILGVRTDGAVSGGFGVGPDFFNGAASKFLDLINRRLNRWLSCSLLNVGAGWNNIKKTPVESVLYDYVFNLNSEVGREIYNRVFQEFKKIPLHSLKKFVNDPERVREVIANIVKDAEEQFKIDRQFPIEERNVDRVMRAMASMGKLGFNVNSRCSKVYDAGLKTHHNHMYLNSFDRYDLNKQYIITSTLRNIKTSFWFTYFGTEQEKSFNAIFEANNSYTPIAFNNLFLRGFVSDKNFSASNWETEKSILNHIIPPAYKSEINFNDFMQSRKTQEAHVDYEFILRADALNYLANFSYDEIRRRLENFVLYHPQVSEFQTEDPTRYSKDDPMETTEDKLKYDIELIARSISEFLSRKKTASQRLHIYEAIMQNELFKEVGGEFIISLLPQDKIKDLVSLSMNAVNADADHINYDNSQRLDKDFLHSLNYLIKTIESRSFDMRLQINGDMYEQAH